MDSPSLELVEKVGARFGTGFLRFACPGDQQDAPTWILRFSDPDCREQVFTGEDAEARAWAAWDQFAPSYNCYLFQAAPIAATPLVKLQEALAGVLPALLQLPGDVQDIYHDEIELARALSSNLEGG